MQKAFLDIAENATDDVLKFIANKSAQFSVFTFTGDVGAGKTTLIKKLVKAFGSEDIVNSPTFSLVNEYLGPGDFLIYHFDWYRINHVSELYDAGITEYFEVPKAILLIEWPEIGAEILKKYSVCNIHIMHKNEVRDYFVEYNE